MPRTQVHISMTRPPPSTSGIHAPAGIFSRFEVRKTASMKPNGTSVSSTAHIGHFHLCRTTVKDIRVLTIMVPVTATP
ncbi:hypothetical protein D9M72_584250 [compost metagenome]